MSETTFENAKIGDRVYSPLYPCKNQEDKTNAVIQVINDGSFPLQVLPDILGKLVSKVGTFTIDGKFLAHGGQVLFWENPIHSIPTRPKRKVVKKGWIGICPTSTDFANFIAHTTCIYLKKDDVPPIPGVLINEIEYEYEVEE